MIYPERVAPGGFGAHDVAIAGANATPPVAASAAVLLGQTLAPWVVILTVVFLTLQIAYLAFKFARDVRGKGSREDG